MNPNGKRRPDPVTTIEIDKVLSASELALKIRTAGDFECWIPRKLILDGSIYEEPPEDGEDTDDDRPDGGTLHLPTWFVTKEEIPCR